MNKFLLAFMACASMTVAYAQTKTLSEKDYQNAESFLSYHTQQYVDHSFSYPNWLPGDRFWYKTLTPQGSEFILIDPVKKTRTPAFDAQKLAAAISSAQANR
jgi:hypothetical protein